MNKDQDQEVEVFRLSEDFLKSFAPAPSAAQAEDLLTTADLLKRYEELTGLKPTKSAFIGELKNHKYLFEFIEDELHWLIK